ncbi:hypothetical protein B0H21DRAFT_724020 [Amylocystis lapponica]|nr:hypothetical protein B0H21DRAFT_724020 [Amylocystis lapponica]
MRLHLTDLPPYIAEDVIDMQGRELARIRSELLDIQAQNEELKKHVDIGKVQREMQGMLESMKQAEQLGVLRARCHELEAENVHLSQEVDDTRKAHMELQREYERSEVGSSRCTPFRFDLTWNVSQTHCETLRAENAANIAEASQLCDILRASLEFVEDGYAKAQNNCQHTEEMLAATHESNSLLQKRVDGLLGMLSESEMSQERLKKELSDALARCKLNALLLEWIDEDLNVTQLRESQVVAELREARDKVVQCRCHSLDAVKGGDERLEAVSKCTVYDVPPDVLEQQAQPAHCRHEGEIAETEDPSRAVAPKVQDAVEEICYQFAQRRQNLKSVQEVGAMHTTRLDNLVWTAYPHLGYFVEPADVIGVNNRWEKNRSERLKTLLAGEPIEIFVPSAPEYLFSLGTFVIDPSETMDVEQLMALEKKAMQALVLSTVGKHRDIERHEVREMYAAGTLSALKIPIRRGTGLIDSRKLHESFWRLVRGSGSTAAP